MTLNFAVPVTTSGFDPSAGVKESFSLHFTDRELAHALFTTGRARDQIFSHGRASIAEFLHRVAVIPAYLTQDPGGVLQRSELARSLDRSEKGNLSYALGQALAAVFSRKAVGIRTLLHVDRYVGDPLRAAILFGPSNRRPDLFGATQSGEWVVVEAKGRTNTWNADLVAKVKLQACNVRSINGSPPSLAFGSITHGDPRTGLVRLHAVDPEPDTDGLAWRVDRDSFSRSYYEPFLSVLDAFADRNVQDSMLGRYEVVDLNFLGLRIGLDRQLASTLRQRRQSSQTAGTAEAVEQALAGGATDDDPTDDGTWFETRWDEWRDRLQ